MTEQFRQPEYLTENDETLFRVRCPIHGFIHFSCNERKVIDHPLFRRLRYIRQLALTELVYPGATHTRFEHSLGVMEVATRLFDNLAAKYGDVMQRTFQSVADISDRPLAKARQLVRLAALLHDIGHASFSHAAEKVVNKGIGHEALTCMIVEESAYLQPLLDTTYWDGCAALITQVIRGERDLAPQLSLLHDIVSGQMDADRTDYLIRDSHHCGVDYGHFDYLRMVESVALQVNDLGGLDVALHIDGIHTFEALILARYQMNTQVYYHRLRRIYDEYLIRYHKALGDAIPDTPDKVLAENDVTMLARMMEDTQVDQGERSVWAQRIIERKHHRVLHDTGVNATVRDVKKSTQVYTELGKRFPEAGVILDVASANIHKLLTPDTKDEEESIDLALTGRNIKNRSVGYESQILSKIPQQFRCARIFADVGEDPALRDSITEAANQLWRAGE